MASNTSPDPARSKAAVVAELRHKLAPLSPKDLDTRSPLPTGFPRLDEVLGGGLPRGRIVEVVGTTGRMSLGLSVLAGATQQGQAAFIDGADALDVEAAEALGVHLPHLLWVQLKGSADSIPVADLLLGAGGFGLVVVYLCGAVLPRRAVPWPRLQQRCQKAGTTLLILSDEPLAGSFTAVTLRIEREGARWERVPGGRSLLRGQAAQVRIVHNRLGAPGDVGRVELLK